MDNSVQNSGATDSAVNSNGLPPLPPLPPENEINLNAALVQNAEVASNNSTVVPVQPVAVEPQVANNAVTPEVKTVDAPVVNLIPGPVASTQVSTPETLVTKLPVTAAPVQAKKTDTYTVLIAFLGVILFVLLAFVGYLVYQVINLPSTGGNTTVSYPK